VQFNLKGRKWDKDGKTSYFNTLQAWKITKEGKADPRTQTRSEASKAADLIANASDEIDDLPF